MGVWHLHPSTKSSGGKIVRYRTKRKFEKGRTPTMTTIGEKKLKKVRVRGGGEKLALRFAFEANILDPKTKKIIKSKIIDVLENKANLHFIRQKVITKGAIIKTEAGKVKVTSRPGQDGIVNGVLVE